jgi:hypothetical protein
MFGSATFSTSMFGTFTLFGFGLGSFSGFSTSLGFGLRLFVLRLRLTFWFL